MEQALSRSMSFALLTFSVVANCSTSASARSAEDVRVIRVLSGDAVVVATYTRSNEVSDNARYVFLAGCGAPLPGQNGAVDAKNALTQLLERKKVTLVTAAKSGNRTLGSLYSDQTQDACSFMLSHGLSFYNSSESSYLSAVQVGGYRTLMNKSKFARVGIWKDIDVHYTPSKLAWDKLNLDIYQEQFVNSVANPSMHGFDRPTAATPSIRSSKDSNDWRTGRQNTPSSQSHNADGTSQ